MKKAGLFWPWVFCFVLFVGIFCGESRGEEVDREKTKQEEAAEASLDLDQYDLSDIQDFLNKTEGAGEG